MIAITAEQQREGEKLAAKCLARDKYVILTVRLHGLAEVIETGGMTAADWEDAAEEFAVYLAAAMKIADETR